jgi:putative transposase
MSCSIVKCPDRSCPSISKNASEFKCLRASCFIKGRIAIRLFNKFPYLRKKKLWGNHFWQRGYFVDSVGANEAIIKRYVRYQDKVAKEEEERQLQLDVDKSKSSLLGSDVKATCYAGVFLLLF